MPGVNLAGLASLIIASADLKAVDSVLSAMHAADAAEAADKATPAYQVPTCQPAATSVAVPCDRFEPCCKTSYAPASQSGKISPCYHQPGAGYAFVKLHQQTRLALQPASVEDASSCDSSHTHAPAPIQAPWKVLPWQQPAKQVVQVKVIHQHTDILTKGSLLDMFI